MTKRLMFFCTIEDLMPGFEYIESGRSLKYLRPRMRDTPTFEEYRSGSCIPGVGVSRTGSKSSDDHFLIVDSSEAIHISAIRQRRGKQKYIVEHDRNPNSICFWPGGIFRPGILVAGEVNTLGLTYDSVSLFTEFTCAIVKGFKRIGLFKVGPRAEELLVSSWRLVTMGADEPAEYDLRK